MEELMMTMEKSALPPEGKYRAKVVDIDAMDGKHGPMVRLHFAFNHEGDHHEVTGLASKKLTEKSKLGRWVTTLIGRTLEVGETTTASDLLNKVCQVEIEHKTGDEGRVYANLTDVQADIPF